MPVPELDSRAPASPPEKAGGDSMEPARSPLNLVSAIVVVASDKLWDSTLLEFARTLPLHEKERFVMVVALLLWLATTTSVTLTQLWVDRDDLGPAIAKGVAMGILAALPYSLSATELGLIFFSWSGINKLQKREK
jgi:hypothetical protein